MGRRAGREATNKPQQVDPSAWSFSYDDQWITGKLEAAPHDLSEFPVFPARDGDPLQPAYLLAKSLLNDASRTQQWWISPRLVAKAGELRALTDRRAAFLASLRTCVWSWMLWKRKRLRLTGFGTDKCALECLMRHCTELSRRNNGLSPSDIAELQSYLSFNIGSGTAFFPRDSIVKAIVMSKSAEPALSQSSRIANLEALFDELRKQIQADDSFYYGDQAFVAFPTALTLRSTAADQRADVALLCARRFDEAEQAAKRGKTSRDWKDANYREYGLLSQILAELLPGAVKDRPNAIDELAAWSAKHKPPVWSMQSVEVGLLRAVEQHAKSAPITAPMRNWLTTIRERWSGAHKPDQRQLVRVNDLLGEQASLDIEPGEAWADQARVDVEGATPTITAAWIQLIRHCKLGSGSTPTAKWSKQTRTIAGSIGDAVLAACLCTWFPLVDRPRTQPRTRRHHYEPDYTNLIIDPHMDILKGLCWVAALIQDPPPDLARAIGRLALSAYRKVAGIGPRAVKVGNAAVYALGQMPTESALGQLAMLRVKVKFGAAQKGIEKALTAAAARLGLPRDEMEELGVPTYGLTGVGVRHETFGEEGAETAGSEGSDQAAGAGKSVFTAAITLTGIGGADLVWYKGPRAGIGKPQRSVPAAVKAGHAEDLKDLKSAAKDIAAMLPAQRDRLDSMFLDRRSWSFEKWRERYLDHPLVGVLARRLIWSITPRPGEKPVAAIHLETEGGTGHGLVGVAGRPVAIDDATAAVSLWHPIEASADEVLAWRRFMEDRRIKQPFKQAHREVYLLTDAERNTRVYSNRFAAHILRQHQFNALCGVRGWKNQLRLMVDAEYEPARRLLPAWSIRAEYWIEGAGDNFGTDTNEAGVYNHVVTDQVRFYAIGSAIRTAHAGGGGYATRGREGSDAPLPLDQVPPLVFSEVMRDVDLFVGVASVGNNPQWSDGGPEGRYRDYWWSFGFKDLTESGQSRKQLLERLVPRLKIAPVCSFSGNFLAVKGKLRAYKIHLGSGNILMEPNDHYLCIVPTSRDDQSAADVFLPFEGDRTLAIILSKAFMLAEDDRIKDPTITRQISHR